MRRGPGEPLWNGSPGASLPSFAALRKKVAPAGAKPPPSTPRPRRSGQFSGPLRIRRLRLLFVPLSCRLRRPSSEHTSLAPFPQNRNTAKTTYRSVAPPHSAREGSPLGTCALPHQIETVHFDLRRTFRRSLQASSREGTRRAAVDARSIWERELRRIPANKDAAAAPLRSPRGLRSPEKVPGCGKPGGCRAGKIPGREAGLCPGHPAKGGGMGQSWQTCTRRRLKHTKTHRPEGFPLRATRMISTISYRFSPCS